MREVFADAGYWVAVQNPDDQFHDRAIAAAERLGSCQIVTTEMVLVEFLNFVGGAGEHNRRLASETVMKLRDSPSVEVIAQTSAQFNAAVSRYANRLDQRWSLTDCSSFLLMEQRGISEALAYDRDFEQAGFIPLLRYS